MPARTVTPFLPTHSWVAKPRWYVSLGSGLTSHSGGTPIGTGQPLPIVGRGTASLKGNGIIEE